MNISFLFGDGRPIFRGKLLVSGRSKLLKNALILLIKSLTPDLGPNFKSCHKCSFCQYEAPLPCEDQRNNMNFVFRIYINFLKAHGVTIFCSYELFVDFHHWKIALINETGLCSLLGTDDRTKIGNKSIILKSCLSFLWFWVVKSYIPQNILNKNMICKDL